MAVNPNSALGSRDWTFRDREMKHFAKASFVLWIHTLLSLRDRYSHDWELFVLSRTKDQTPARTVYFLIENTYIKLRKQRRHGPALKSPFWKCIGFDIWYLLTEHLHTNWFFHYISCSSAPSRLPNILLSLPMTFNFPPQTPPWSIRCCLSGEGGASSSPASWLPTLERCSFSQFPELMTLCPTFCLHVLPLSAWFPFMCPLGLGCCVRSSQRNFLSDPFKNHVYSKNSKLFFYFYSIYYHNCSHIFICICISWMSVSSSKV